jgi:signal transduction histidine kinase
MGHEGSRGAAAVRLVVAALAVAAAAGALAIVERPRPLTIYAGRSSLGAVLTIGAGVALIAGGLVTTLGGRSRRLGDLALLAGLTWFAPVFVAWREAPPVVISLAMPLAGLTFAFLFHLGIAYPTGRLGSGLLRALVGLVYLETALTALVLALVRDPYFDPGCWSNCTVNSFLVRSLPSFAHALETDDRWFVASAAAVLAAICVARLVGSSLTARRRLLPVVLPVTGFAGAVIARAIVLQGRPVEDPFETSLFAIFAVASVSIVLLAGGLVWVVARSRIDRRAVARVVSDLDEAPAPGSLEPALAAALGDPALRVAYWLPGTRRFVDAGGRPVAEPATAPGRALTRLTRNARTVAVISHAGDASELEPCLGPAIRLALENERLQAQVLAQVEELRASRARIVETADVNRLRLERDLHDGAQQRLLALSYEVRLARADAEADGDAATERMLARSIEETHAALEELRELAHGIYPAVLAEAGLDPALASLSDTAPLPLEILGGDHRRYPAAVETAAYFAVVEAVDDACERHASAAAVTVAQDDGRLTVTVSDDGSARTSAMAALADRVGALGGALVVEPTTLRVEIPCA